MVVNKTDVTNSKPEATDLTTVNDGETVEAAVENSNNTTMINPLIVAMNWIIDQGLQAGVESIATALQRFQGGIQVDQVDSETTGGDITIETTSSGKLKYGSGTVAKSEVITVGNYSTLVGDPAGVVDMTGASASVAGAAGLVPQPAAGDNDAFLRGDATWQELNAPTNWETKSGDFTAVNGGRYMITGVGDITLINSPAINAEFWVMPGDGYDMVAQPIDLLQAASGEKIGGVDANGKLFDQVMYRIIYSGGDTTTGWRVLKVLIQGESYGEGFLVPSSDPAPFFKLPEALPNVTGASSFTSTGNFSLTAGVHYYTDFTIDTGHQMTLAAGTTIIYCSGTATIGGNGIINVTGTAPTIGDSFEYEADGTAGTDASTGGTGGSGGPASAGDGGDGTAGDSGTNATGVNVLGGVARGGGGGGGSGQSGTGGPQAGPAGGNSVSPSGDHGAGGGGGGGAPQSGVGGTGGSNSATNGAGGAGGQQNGAGGGAGGTVGADGADGSNSACNLIIIADTIIQSAAITNEGGAGSNASNGNNGATPGSVGGGGGGGGGGKGGKGGKGGLVALRSKDYQRTTGALSCNGGAGGNGGTGGNGGNAAAVSGANAGAAGGGGAGSGGPAGIGGDAGFVYLEYETSTISGGSVSAVAGVAGSVGSGGTPGTGATQASDAYGDGGDGGSAGTAGASGAGRLFDEVNNSMQITRSLR